MRWRKAKQECPGDENFRHPMTDPQGSYTGVPREVNEVPVQDADDL